MSITRKTIFLSGIEKLYSFSLAGIFCGTSLYIFLNYYFSLKNPAWLFIVTSVFCLVFLINRSQFKFIPTDYAFLSLSLYIFSREKGYFSEESTLASLTFLKYSVIPYFLSRMIPTKQIPLFLKSTIVLILILLAGTALFSIQNPDFFIHDRPIIFNFPRQQGLSAILFGFAFTYFSYLYLSSPLRNKASIACILFLKITLLIIIIYLQSRGTLVASLTTYSLILVLQSNKMLYLKALSMIAIVITVIISIKLMPYKNHHLYTQLISQSSYTNLKTGNVDKIRNEKCNISGNAITIRTILIKKALSLFTEEPLFGIGLRGYKKKLKCDIDYSVPHNLIAHLLSELGTAGFLIFLLLIYYATRNRSPKNKAVMQAFKILTLYYLLILQFSGSNFLDITEFYILLGVQRDI